MASTRKKQVEETVPFWGYAVMLLAGLIFTVGFIVSAFWLFEVGLPFALKPWLTEEARAGGPITFSAPIHVQQGPYKGEKKVATCVSADLKAALEVYTVEEFDEPGILGQFGPRGIFIKERSVDTVSHEVSHFVDVMVEAKGIHDGETRAYLQGYFSECVWTAVK